MLSRIARLSLVTMLTICIRVGANDQPASKPVDDHQSIQGTWRFVPGPDKEQAWPRGLRILITRDMLWTIYPDTKEKRGWKYTINPAKDPKEMDWFPEEDPGKPIHQAGIYSLKGDTLKIWVVGAGLPRPRELGRGTWVLERVTKEAV